MPNTRINLLNIKMSMTAILSGDNPPTATILYPHDVTTSCHIFQVSGGKSQKLCQITHSDVLNIKIPMTAILFGVIFFKEFGESRGAKIG